MAHRDPGAGGRPVAQATYVISVAAELAGMHPQTLRQYDRLGLVTPARAKGRGRRYTSRDIQRLRDVQRLSQEEGVNLAGIQRILELERRVEALEEQRSRMEGRIAELESRRDRVFAASPSGQVSQLRRGERAWTTRPGPGDAGAVVPWTRWYTPDLEAFIEAVAALRRRGELLSIEAAPGGGQAGVGPRGTHAGSTPARDGRHVVVDSRVVPDGAGPHGASVAP